MVSKLSERKILHAKWPAKNLCDMNADVEANLKLFKFLLLVNPLCQFYHRLPFDLCII